MKSRRGRNKSPIDLSKDATIDALNQVLEPLIELMLDAGVSVYEFNLLVRQQAVRVAMKRLAALGVKESRSRAAIMTGLTRSEVSKILQPQASREEQLRATQLPARRILAAWSKYSPFCGRDGHPGILPIFGKGKSFEKLVNRYGGGMPVRAMLDEMIQTNAIKLLDGQRVTVQIDQPALDGRTLDSITATSELASRLLRTLAHNRHKPADALFEATVMGDANAADVPNVRRDVAAIGSRLVKTATSLFTRSLTRRLSSVSDNSRMHRVGLTVFYFEHKTVADTELPPNHESGRRKNFRRDMAESASPRLTDGKD